MAQAEHAAKGFDVAVIGGGMVGTAIAYGCAARGAHTALVDQGDLSLRAARANAGLIYSQGKGEGLPAYAAWTRRSIALWPAFAEAMASAAGRPIGFRQRGVLAFCLGEEELEARRALLQRMHNQLGGPAAPVHLLDRHELDAMLPEVRLGPRVVGATYSPEDCDVNALPLLRALNAGFLQAGGTHLLERTVTRIAPRGDGFDIVSDRDTVHADKVVVACGLGIPALAADGRAARAGAPGARADDRHRAAGADAADPRLRRAPDPRGRGADRHHHRGGRDRSGHDGRRSRPHGGARRPGDPGAGRGADRAKLGRHPSDDAGRLPDLPAVAVASRGVRRGVPLRRDPVRRACRRPWPRRSWPASCRMTLPTLQPDRFDAHTT